MRVIPRYEEGSNITILNTMYRRGVDPNDGIYKNILDILYKDLDTGQKYMEEIDDPEYTYHMAKPDKRVSYPRLFIEEKDTFPVTTRYRNIESSIAKQTGLQEFYYNNINVGNRKENRKLHLHPDVFGSDRNIEDYYRSEFAKAYKNDTFPVSKAFFDIEVDGINAVGDFPQPGECPINSISLILQEQKQIFSFLLRTEGNEQIKEFEKSVNDGSIFPELASFLADAVGGSDRAAAYDMNFNFNFLFYDPDDEINLIKDLFVAINTFKPDFVLAWNMAFDVPYIIARIQTLGYDPADVMSHKDFTYRFAEYRIDNRPGVVNEPAERCDYASIASYSVYIDQMIQFASRRKGRSKYVSYSLDAIGEIEAGVRKLDYKHITTNIAELPYKAYKTFVFYNIMDTIVQYCIEFNTGDIDYLFSKAVMNDTRYSKVHRQSVYLANRGAKDFYNNDGCILGNNVNKFNDPPTEKFPGAFVADPLKVKDTHKEKVNGRAIQVFKNCVDFDYSSLYPSIIREFNIIVSAMIALANIPNKVFDKENPRNLDNWTRGGAFIRDMQSQVWAEVAHRWFNMPSYSQLYREVEEFFETKMQANNGLKLYNKEGKIEPLVFYNPNLQPFPIITYKNTLPNLVNKFVPVEDKGSWERWRENAIKNPNQRY